MFIHCAAGVHRAPMMALAVLGSMGWDLKDAMQLIEKRRPVADFAEVYVESVRRFLDGAMVRSRDRGYRSAKALRHPKRKQDSTGTLTKEDIVETEAFKLPKE